MSILPIVDPLQSMHLLCLKHTPTLHLMVHASCYINFAPNIAPLGQVAAHAWHHAADAGCFLADSFSKQLVSCLPRGKIPRVREYRGYALYLSAKAGNGETPKKTKRRQ